MRYIKSCGFIVYSEAVGERRYLVIESLNGDVGFPKGHVESGERELETAIRELREEVGINAVSVDKSHCVAENGRIAADAIVIDGFRRDVEYMIPRSADKVKRVVYFLCRCFNTEVLKCQETEVGRAEFLSYAEAIGALTFENTKKILQDAENFIVNGDF